MNWATALERLETLNKGQVIGLQTVLKHEVQMYKRCIRNYPPDRMRKYGKPHLAKLETALKQVETQLEDL